MSAASASNFQPTGGAGNDAATQRSLADGRAAIAAGETFAIEYADDVEGMATDRTGPKRRVARVRCPECGSNTEVHQAMDLGSGAFSPDAVAVLTGAAGWQSDGARMYCGKWCMQRYQYKMAQHGNQPLPAVKSINDKSYAATMYKTAPATTPAAPPVHSGKRR